MDSAGSDVNLGLFDGEVSHGRINEAVGLADKVVLFGEQTRLPYFPDDVRLLKLHAGDPRVLLFWKVLKKVPENLRHALIDAPLSLTLVRGESLLHFESVRCHQALHIGCRRRTIYLPERLLREAEERGYDYWALAEGLIYAAWMLLDYLLLVDLLQAFAEQSGGRASYRLGEAVQRRLVEAKNRHRRAHVEKNRSEVEEFLDFYRPSLLRLNGAQIRSEDPFALARRLFDAEREQRWAQDKMERVAQVFKFPKMFLFDRDIIHGAARELALAQGQEVAPQSFADVLHDYRDDLRFERRPLMTAFGKSVVPKPRAVFLTRVVALGERGLRGFFEAYGSGDEDVGALVHPLWMHLCSLSSDPAGVFARVGRLRAIGRERRDEVVDGLLGGLLVRLDRAENYEELVSQVEGLGAAARAEMEALVARQSLREEDEWEVFKGRKQGIVARARQVLSAAAGEVAQVRADVHGDALVKSLLGDSPHRLTSDPGGVLAYVRAYHRQLQEFGPDDPDSDFLLAAVLVRLDRSDHYPRLLAMVEAMGKPAFSALHGVFEQIPERDMGRREILKQARILWSKLLARSGEIARRRRR